MGHSSNASSVRWALALAFQPREAFACLDVDFSAAVSLAPRRRCRANGALPDEVHLYQRTRTIAENEPGSRTLLVALRDRCVTRWCWRVRLVLHPGRMARLKPLG